MHELVNHHVVTHWLRHLDEPPVQADAALPGTRSPAPPLIPHADVRNNETVAGRELEETRRQLCLGSAAQVSPDFWRQGLKEGIVVLAAELLFFDPRTLTFGERDRFASRTPPRDRDADGAVIRHA
jgi:hypothetical protein